MQLGYSKVELLEIEHRARLEPKRSRHLHKPIAKQEHEKKEAPRVTGRYANHLELLPVQRVLDAHVNQQDAENAQVRSVVDCVGNEGAADFAGHGEFSRLGE